MGDDYWGVREILSLVLNSNLSDRMHWFASLQTGIFMACSRLGLQRPQCFRHFFFPTWVKISPPTLKISHRTQKRISNSSDETKAFVSAISKGSFWIIMGWPHNLQVLNLQLSHFSHNIEKEKVWLSNLHNILHTCHQVKSTTTTKVSLTFDPGKGPQSWIKKRNKTPLARNLNSSLGFQSIAS